MYYPLTQISAGFYINLPLGAVVAGLLLFVTIPEAQYKPPAREVFRTAVNSLDLPGFILIAPAAIMFFLALQWGGNQHPWGSSVVIGLFVGAVVTFILFLLWERRRGDDAMVPFNMLKMRIIWSASATMFFFMGVLFTANYYLPIYFQAVKDDSAVMSGVHILPTIISQVVFAMTSGAMGEFLPLLFSERTTTFNQGHDVISGGSRLLSPLGGERDSHKLRCLRAALHAVAIYVG